MDQLYKLHIGDRYSYRSLPQGWSIDTGDIASRGSNLEWNLDTINLGSAVQTDSILDPATTPGAATFTDADFCWKEHTGIYQYYRFSSDTVFYLDNYIASANRYNPPPITTIVPTPLSSGWLFQGYQTTIPGGQVWTYNGRYNAWGG
jgi:hypothetical protein